MCLTSPHHTTPFLATPHHISPYLTAHHISPRHTSNPATHLVMFPLIKQYISPHLVSPPHRTHPFHPNTSQISSCYTPCFAIPRPATLCLTMCLATLHLTIHLSILHCTPRYASPYASPQHTLPRHMPQVHHFLACKLMADYQKKKYCGNFLPSAHRQVGHLFEISKKGNNTRPTSPCQPMPYLTTPRYAVSRHASLFVMPCLTIRLMSPYIPPHITSYLPKCYISLILSRLATHLSFAPCLAPPHVSRFASRFATHLTSRPTTHFVTFHYVTPHHLIISISPSSQALI